MMSIHAVMRPLLLAAVWGLLSLPAGAQTFSDPPFFKEKLAKKELPPLAERL